MTDFQHKVRPIILNADMVNALLSGKKTVTRLPIKGDVQFSERSGFSVVNKLGVRMSCGLGFTPQETQQNFINGRCPIAVGDLLWVRETFKMKLNNYNDLKGEYCAEYAADGGCRLMDANIDNNDHLAYAVLKDTWTPSIHMPKYANRLVLKVKRISVERVQSITDKQAVAEGMPSAEEAQAMAIDANMTWYQKPKVWYKSLWEKLYGTWDDDPYVWCIEFDVIDKNIEEV